MSTTVEERSGRPDIDQANKNTKPNKKEHRENGETRFFFFFLKSRSGCKNSEKNLVDDEIPVHGDSHASSSHEASSEPTFKRIEDLGKHSICLISLKTEIARSVKGPKLQGPRAGDAMAEPYVVQKILVT